MLVIQAYRYALNPSPAQERMPRSHAGAARFAWNSKCVCQEAFRDPDRELRGFVKSARGKRKGSRIERVGRRPGPPPGNRRLRHEH